MKKLSLFIIIMFIFCSNSLFSHQWEMGVRYTPGGQPASIGIYLYKLDMLNINGTPYREATTSTSWLPDSVNFYCDIYRENAGEPNSTPVGWDMIYEGKYYLRIGSKWTLLTINPPGAIFDFTIEFDGSTITVVEGTRAEVGLTYDWSTKTFSVYNDFEGQSLPDIAKFIVREDWYDPQEVSSGQQFTRLVNSSHRIDAYNR